MFFDRGFSKIAFISSHTKEKLVRSTPKDKGGRNGKGNYFLRYHPKEKRWSCTCPDWTIRRRRLGDEHKAHHDCKHILAHKLRKKVWNVKKGMKPVPKMEQL